MYDFATKTDHKIIVIGSSRQLGKCLAEGTEVLTVNRGIVPIEQLTTDDLVYGYNKDGSITPAKIKKVFDSGYKEVVDLVNHGRVLATSSEDHVWLTSRVDSNTTSERKVKDFYKGVMIERRFIDPLGGEINEPHAYAIGAFLGDGCSLQKYNAIHLSSENSEVPHKVATVLNTQYKKLHDSNYTWHIGEVIEKYHHVKPTYCAYYDEWCRNRKAHQKIINLEVVKTWNRYSMLELLAGLLDTDGCVQRYKNELNITFTSQSKSLIDAFAYLVHYLFQYKCTILQDKRDKYKNGPCYFISITNNLINKRIIKTLTPHLAKEKKKWKEEYNECLENNTNPTKVGVKKQNKRFVKCYDISVDNETSLYLLSNGLITHNSFFLSVLAIETCLKTPNVIVKFIAPKTKDIKRIIAPLMKEILQDCPKDLKPSFKIHDNTYNFANGSEIQLAGTDNGHAESIRGNKAHLCIIDEAGFCDDLDYIVNSILIPTTTTTHGKIIMASTPSRSPDHDFMTFMKEAELENRFIKKTIYDNPRLTEDDINRLAEALGGKESVDFRREYLVEKIVAEDDAVIPEFTKDLQSRVVKEWAKPPYFDAYVGMDIGAKDLTAVLFGYYDFIHGKIIIEDELIIKGSKMLTDELAEKIHQKEMQLWTHKVSGEKIEPYLRIADNNNLILLNDLTAKHRLNFLPTSKDNKIAMLNSMRIMMRNEQIIIHPRCQTLIFHLESAIWNRSRDSYARSADKGHYDAVDALLYLTRNVILQKNPYPPDYHYNFKDPNQVFRAEEKKNVPANEAERHFFNMFKVKKPGFRRY